MGGGGEGGGGGRKFVVLLREVEIRNRKQQERKTKNGEIDEKTKHNRQR